ncbi:MAG: zinc metallopeptidase [Gammaproteobacteria bacterium]|nr:zinc metallopeptidase [Gammaproteobacteria bacterium]
MLIAIGILLLLGLIYLPNIWLTRTLKKYEQPKDKFPGTGGQFASHLLKQLKIDDITVELTEKGDHYDPVSGCVRLSPQHHNEKSLTAIVVAAHEVGHAMQHKSQYGLFKLRTFLAITANITEKIGVLILMITPILTLISRSPTIAVVTTLSAIAFMGIGLTVHLITLPVELDASFKRALPVLKAGHYLDEEDYPAARKILKAAALTYVAGALTGLLNFSRWMAILRR